MPDTNIAVKYKEGFRIVCRDANGNVKWEDFLPIDKDEVKTDDNN